jgi:hypothetical protein
MFTAWNSTRQTLESYGGVSAAVSVLADLLYLFVELVVVLAVYDVSFYR